MKIIGPKWNGEHKPFCARLLILPYARVLIHLDARFKLQLPSSSTIDPMENQLFDELPPLPSNKTIVEVFADFYAYLLECSAKYICESHENGNALWASVKDGIHFVISHPNGWGGREQMLLRDAALLAGLIPDDTPKSQDRVSFVTEGEASLNFVIRSGTLSASLKVPIFIAAH